MLTLTCDICGIHIPDIEPQTKAHQYNPRHRFKFQLDKDIVIDSCQNCEARLRAVSAAAITELLRKGVNDGKG